MKTFGSGKHQYPWLGRFHCSNGSGGGPGAFAGVKHNSGAKGCEKEQQHIFSVYHEMGSFSDF
jgi:hypothetical protein